MPLSVLIATEVFDVHAVAVDLVLRQKGHEVVRLFGEDLPQRLAAAYTIDDMGIPGLHLEAPGLTLGRDRFDVVWFRRPCAAVLPPALLHPEDRAPASIENNFLLDGIWACLGLGATWVNPMGSRRASRSKLLQLSLATQVGLPVPRTLASNDPGRIREFIRSNPRGGTIFKAFDSHFWHSPEGRRHLNYTTTIEEAALPSDALLRAVPGIFQRRVDKAFELRVTCFGRHAVTAKLLTQAHEITALDWRGIDPRAIPIEPFELPREIAERCWRLMERLGIVFGCFDFIVTPRGEYVFLEVNEMGQFLWIEEVNPEIRLLDTCVDFLLARTPDFVPSRKAPAERVSFADVAKRAGFDAAIDFDIAHHISSTVKQPARPVPAAAAAAPSPA